MTLKIGYIGYGEAGQCMVPGLQAAGANVRVWDVLLESASAAPRLVAEAEASNVTLAPSRSDAVGDRDIIFSAVTTDQSLVAAEQLAPLLSDNTLYLDLNSTSPGKKQKVAQVMSARAHTW